MDWEQIWKDVQTWISNTGIKIIIAILILIVSFAIINKIAKKIARREKKLENAGKVDKTLYRTLSYVFKIVLKILVVVALVGYLGLDTSGISALIASLGVGVGLAVNGVGKTTSIGKLANKFVKEDKSVTIAAADTFRAAADQLTVWADRAKVRIIKHAEGADASAVVFDAISSAKAKNTDVLIIDTAGRLHVKANLMEELKKMDRVVKREFPEANFYKLIVLDATTGQNASSQVEVFNEAVGLDGIILTKLDGTAKGGFIVSLSYELEIPVCFVGTGEKIDDIEDFDAREFIEALF